MELTEVDAPKPIAPKRQHDTLEDRERRASRGSTYSRGSHTQAELTEVAAPRPTNGHNPASNDDLEARRKIEHEARPNSKPTGLATELCTVSWLIFFSLLGTLARLGVEAITLYPNSPFPSRVLWANLGGSFVMGFLAEDRKLFRHEWGAPDPNAPPSSHGKIKKTIPLFIGLATGFCGSFTSFSSFMRDAFLAMSNALEPPSPTSPYHSSSQIAARNGGFSFLALMAILIIHPAVSLAALQAGAQFALLLQPITPTLPFNFSRKVMDPLAILLGFGCWSAAILMSVFPPGNATQWRFRALMPLVFAPPGCLLRYYVSKHLNARIPSFPLGTFAVNMFGTAVLGMAWDLQHAGSIGASPNASSNACSVLQGVMEGFCGCLTTVSTWVAELSGLKRRHGWMYGLTSAGVGLGIMVIIMGSMAWTIGFRPPQCS